MLAWCAHHRASRDSYGPHEDRTVLDGCRPDRNRRESAAKRSILALHSPARGLPLPPAGRSRPVQRKGPVNRIKAATVALLLASFIALPQSAAFAQNRDRRDRAEDYRDWR